MCVAPALAEDDLPIRHISVAVGNTQDDFLHGVAQICAHNVTTSGLEAFVSCDTPCTGQYISLSRISAASRGEKLTLCDVQLHGKSRTWFAFFMSEKHGSCYFLRMTERDMCIFQLIVGLNMRHWSTLEKKTLNKKVCTLFAILLMPCAN